MRLSMHCCQCYIVHPSNMEKYKIYDVGYQDGCDVRACMRLELRELVIEREFSSPVHDETRQHTVIREHCRNI